MKLIIDIPDHLYKLLKDLPSDSNEGTIENVLMKAVENGTPIPEHGRLGDLDELYKKVQNEENDTEDEKSMKALFRYLIRQADTILEATKESSDAVSD